MTIRSLKSFEQKPVEMEGAAGAKMRMLIGPQEGACNFYMRHFEVAPGGHTPYHCHDYEHEVFVLAGTGVVRGESGSRPFQPHDVIFIPAGEMHQFCNTGNEPCEFICLIPACRSCKL